MSRDNNSRPRLARRRATSPLKTSVQYSPSRKKPFIARAPAVTRGLCTRRQSKNWPSLRPRRTPLGRHVATELFRRAASCVYLTATSALGQGEVLGLTQIGDVEVDRRTVRVERHLVTVSGRPPSLEPPKTESARRPIPEPRSVIDLLVRRFHELDECAAGARRRLPAGPAGIV